MRLVSLATTAVLGARCVLSSPATASEEKPEAIIILEEIHAREPIGWTAHTNRDGTTGHFVEING